MNAHCSIRLSIAHEQEMKGEKKWLFFYHNIICTNTVQPTKY